MIWMTRLVSKCVLFLFTAVAEFDSIGPFWLQKESELSKPPTDDEITTLVNREEEE